ncbi:hypothetical protein NUU61_004760 [Penicillium alfredii]|uniref:LEA domain protein n=1 Tax=Penicillium alfredii TaxID=1506179 RepID=A0A9W9F8F4_9EURO|nr:uncharacterized protein NUU61_004760 [Penicillium alfredii]KAJ5095404.1 hypothetical protein NUU61_004760 [Penicillium alfredii]
MFVARVVPAMKPRVATPFCPSILAVRSISGTARLHKGPIETTRDTLKKADRTVSDAAVKGLDKGEKARDKIKDAIGATTQEAKTKSEYMKGEAAEYAGQGKGKAEQAAGEVKGKTQAAMGEMTEKAREAKRTQLG